MQPRSERPLLLQLKYHEVTYNSTFEDDVMLTGNIVSLLMGAIICFTVSMIWPEDYDFQSMREIRLVPSEDGDDEDDTLGFTKVSCHLWGPLAYIDSFDFMRWSFQCKLFEAGRCLTLSLICRMARTRQRRWKRRSIMCSSGAACSRSSSSPSGPC